MHIIGCGVDFESQRNDWIPQFREVTGVIFVVDLYSYDKALPPSPHNIRLMKCIYLFNIMGTNRSIYTKLMESLYLFEAVVNSHLYKESSIFLFFTGLENFRTKLSDNPLSAHFPDYDGGTDVDKAVEYIHGLFQRINKAQLRVRSEVLLLEDEDRFRLDSVLDTLSDELLPMTGRSPISRGERTRAHRASSSKRSSAKICSMNLTQANTPMASGASLRVRG